MTDRSHFTQTTSEITLDIPTACCIEIGLDDQLARVQRSLARARNPKKIESLHNQRRNLEAAKAAFEPVRKKVLGQPLYTEGHNALIETVIGNQRRQILERSG